MDQSSSSADIRRGALSFTLAMLAFACLDGARKELSDAIPAVQIVLFRYVFFVAFVAYWLRTRGLRLFRTRHPWVQGLRSTIMLGEAAVFVLALRYASLADAHAVFAVAPFAGVLLSVLLLRERVSLHIWLALVCSAAGILIILRPDFGSLAPGLLLALLSAVLFALYGVLTRLVSAGDSPDTSFAYMTVIGLGLSAALGVSGWVDPSYSDWLYLLLTAVSAAIGQYLMIRAFAYAPAVTLQPYSYFLTVWAIIISLVFFREPPGIGTLVGMLLVVGGGLYMFLFGTRGERSDGSGSGNAVGGAAFTALERPPGRPAT